jgi:predicted HicB family RNase H-like nuclease
MMQHKGYKGCFEFDEDSDIFHGQIIGIKDIVTFQGRSIDELKLALHDSVDDYLEMCEQEKKPPDKPFSGKFSLRLTPELHSNIAESAALTKTSINSWVIGAVENFLKQEKSKSPSTI